MATTPEGGSIVVLPRGVISFDARDTSILMWYKWRIQEDHGNLYAVTRILNKNGKYFNLRMHRLLLSPKQDEQIDHIDGNGLNNRRCNLRIATNQQNHFNRKPDKNTSSRYKGVCWIPYRSKWKSCITKKGVHKFLGYFEQELDAARAYNEAAKELFGAFAYLNRVEDVHGYP